MGVTIVTPILILNLLMDYCTGTAVSTATIVSVGVSTTSTATIVSVAGATSSVVAEPQAANDTNTKATANNFNVFI